MDKENNESTTWLNLFPTEIIFMIFNYLSSNDIIYAFSLFNQRFNHLLLQNPYYLNNFELPITNLKIWKNILSVVGSEIECLNMKINYLSIPLKYFTNLKSLIISSPYGLPEKELISIVESEQFQNLHSFKIIEEKIFSDKIYKSEKNYLFKRIFNRENSLKILIIPSLYIKTLDNLNMNFNLHSITLTINSFENIFLLIQSTPNLEYLNVDSYIFEDNSYEILTTISNIKLKEFYLTLRSKSDASDKMDELIHSIKQLSLSLNCLSLNLIYLPLKDQNEIPFNSNKLQQFLESIKELKQFHLYAKLERNFIIQNQIVSRFKNQYWFDHHWSFGMHDKYFYTLPFHFDYLYKFYESSNDVQSNNPEILINNPRLWSNVKGIEIEKPPAYFYSSILRKLKIVMPKLNLIKFNFYMGITDPYTYLYLGKKDQINLTFNNLTTLQFTKGFIEEIKDLIIYLLPNLKHLILSSEYLPSIHNELSQIFNQRIQRLDIDSYAKFDLLANRYYVYFSNVEFIYFNIKYVEKDYESYANIIIKILTNFKSLKSLVMFIQRIGDIRIYPSFGTDLIQLIEYLNTNTITKKYNIKHFREYALFSKQESNHNSSIKFES